MQDANLYSDQMKAQMKEALDRYGDIIDRQHPVSVKYRPMPDMDRAAQFSPFAALTGYHETLKESQNHFAVDEADLFMRERWQED